MPAHIGADTTVVSLFATCSNAHDKNMSESLTDHMEEHQVKIVSLIADQLEDTYATISALVSVEGELHEIVPLLVSSIACELSRGLGACDPVPCVYNRLLDAQQFRSLCAAGASSRAPAWPRDLSAPVVDPRSKGISLDDHQLAAFFDGHTLFIYWRSDYETPPRSCTSVPTLP